METSGPGKALEAFGISSDYAKMQLLEQGLINDTYKVLLPGAEGFILQRINPEVFPKVLPLMQNIARVLPELAGPDYTELKLLRGPEDEPWFTDAAGSYWRAFNYIPGSITYRQSAEQQIARESGRIIGRFHHLVSGIPLEEIHITLPDFHNLKARREQLKKSLSEARPERLKASQKWRELGETLYDACGAIPYSELPRRLCHNDTKLSNILFDAIEKKALCLIDLDTLMPGYLLYDFGDAGRCLLYPPETEPPVEKEEAFDLDLFEAFYKGLLHSGIPLEDKERQTLPWGLVLMPLLHGLRALTDYLQNDRYYKTRYPEENLRRAENLLQNSEASWKQLPKMLEICSK